MVVNRMPVNETEINDRIKKQIDNEVATQRQSINNNLNIQKQTFDSSINRNNQYLDEQIKSLKTNKIVNDDKIMTMQNRFGGIYSGGKDYQLAENQRSNLASQDSVRKDITDRNQGVLDQYNTLASQASEQIRMLETQAPDRIRQLVNEEIEKQRQIQMQEEKWALEKQQMQMAIDRARQEAAEAAAAAARAASSKKSSSSSTAKATTSNLTNQYNQYKSQQSTVAKPTALANLDTYYKNQQKLIPTPVKKSVLQPVAPAKNRNLSAWQKMKMMGG